MQLGTNPLSRLRDSSARDRRSPLTSSLTLPSSSLTLAPSLAVPERPSRSTLEVGQIRSPFRLAYLARPSSPRASRPASPQVFRPTLLSPCGEITFRTLPRRSSSLLPLHQSAVRWSPLKDRANLRYRWRSSSHQCPRSRRPSHLLTVTLESRAPLQHPPRRYQANGPPFPGPYARKSCPVRVPLGVSRAKSL